jgi:hypothetical protein
MTKPKNEKSVERFSKMTCLLDNCTKATATYEIGIFRLTVAVAVEEQGILKRGFIQLNFLIFSC